MKSYNFKASSAAAPESEFWELVSSEINPGDDEEETEFWGRDEDWTAAFQSETWYCVLAVLHHKFYIFDYGLC